ncbi:MAG: N-acetylmuramoyl-L-alanine amidase-like domain-containing protein [Salinibacter sp.]|uniref:N-acetylmuramoyl-L-alanine amidase-like domain-containing protein n=1 Tax=Salinibacter sp. TaxID=2065818 RepID=UPI002FC309C4
MSPRLRMLSVVLSGLLVGLSSVGGCQPASDAASDASVSQPSTAPPTVRDSVLSPPDTTADRFEAALQVALSHRGDAGSIGALMQAVGRHFRGRPYRTGTLDAPATETLVVRLDGFDCVTFVETTLALARSARAPDTTYAGFARRLAEQRYRDGGPVGYCGRLHYFTEWLTDNADRGHVRRLGPELEGRPLRDTLDFMSTHRSAYARFATNDSLFACVQDMEARLQAQQRRNPVRYVPQDSIRAVYDQLQAGDVVALVSSIDGLDVAHTGLVYAHPDGGRGLLHASLSDGVVVSPDLQRYVQTIDRQIGMVVARPQSIQ